jgi:hypothetical protein
MESESLLQNISEILEATPQEIGNLLERASASSWSIFGRKIYFYIPTFLPYASDYNSSKRDLFPSISVTGNSCSLRCAHCNGKMLETMIPVTSGKELVELCRKIDGEGGVGCLVSGGCRPDGSVPIEGFVEALSEVKRQTDLTVVVHTGVLNEETARQLARARIDAALIDIIGSDDTIKEIYKLNARVEDYKSSLKALHNSGVSFVPHVLVGLHYGKLMGEMRALEMIAEYDPSGLIFIAFIPIRGTPMERVVAPDPFDVARVMIAARRLMPNIPHALGCARPTSEHRKETDVLAVQGGINAIAFPSDEAVSKAKSLGLETHFSSMCCSQVYSDIFSLQSGVH